MPFLSVRVPEDTRNRIKAIAAARGEKLQDLVGALIDRFLEEAERRPPELSEVLRTLRTHEDKFRQQGVAALWVFGSAARGEARPDSDIDLLVDFAPDARPTLLTISALQDDIAEILGRPVDLGERSALKPHLIQAVARDMVSIF